MKGEIRAISEPSARCARQFRSLRRRITDPGIAIEPITGSHFVHAVSCPDPRNDELIDGSVEWDHPREQRIAQKIFHLLADKMLGWCASEPLVARVSRRSTTPNTSRNMSAMSMSATLAVGKVSLSSKCVASRVTARESVSIGPALFFVRLLRDADIRGFAPGTPPRAPRVAPPDARLTSNQSLPLVFSQARPQGAGCQVQVRLLARFARDGRGEYFPDAMACFWSVGGLSRNRRDARRWARDGRRADRAGLHP